MSLISEFSVEVSQIVFSAHLTVLRLVTTVRVKTSKISYLREFSPQVSQIVFSAHLTVLRLVYNCMSKNFQNLISSWFQCTSITNRVLTSFDRFTDTVVISLKTVIWAENTICDTFALNNISVSSEQKYHKSCFQLIWPFYGFIELHAVKLQKTNISVSSEQKYHKSCSQLIWPF